ncbi:MAG TPA: glycosyltransferase family 2 protein [Polyangiaceae bacterium]
MKLAFIIVTYRATPYLDDLFATLWRHTDMANAHIIVVENASNDGTLEALHRITRGHSNVEILPQARNTGFAEGNNIGIARARALGADFVVLLNQDLELCPNWLEPLVAVMHARPEVAAAQPLILLHAEPHLLNTAGNQLHFCGFGYCGDYRRPLASLSSPSEVRSVAFASGAALMLRMSALERSGDFDESLFLYHEDCELQIRLRILGYDCVCIPTSRVMHKYTASFSARKYALLDRNRWLVLLKDWPLDRLIVAAPALVGTELAVLFFAAKAGWWREKLATYGAILQAVPSLKQERKRIEKMRSPNATDGAWLTGAMQFDGFHHPIITHFANPVLQTYWNFARRVLKVR